MFSLILNCPECNEVFNFDKNGPVPESIKCKSCGKSSPSSAYEAVVLCKECRKKLHVPLDIIDDPDLKCPLCDAPVDVETSDDEDEYISSHSGSEAVSKEQLLKDGTFFDKYKIIRLLGRGGMAEVYLAEHLLLKKHCAIKLLLNGERGNDAVFVKRFLREAKISHSLDHPNIVKVFDAGCDFKTGHMFIAMEYIEGKTLMQIAKERKLSEAELLEILGSIAEALKVLKKQNIVHRDIKPSNIMLSDDGVYKLMDLGIAKIDSDHQAGEFTLTMDRQTIGTPSFASPEQCQSAHNVDCRSDIYCLGATLYSLASGKVPYDGTSSVEIILKVIKHDLEPLKNLRGDLSRGFLSMVDRMMSKNPDERPASPDELIDFVETGKLRRMKIKDIPLVCKRMYRKMPPPVKYISGTLLFAAVAASLLYTFAIDGNADETPPDAPVVIAPAAKPLQEKQNDVTEKPESLNSGETAAAVDNSGKTIPEKTIPEKPEPAIKQAVAKEKTKTAEKAETPNQTASGSSQNASVHKTALGLREIVNAAITPYLKMVASAEQTSQEKTVQTAVQIKADEKKKLEPEQGENPAKTQLLSKIKIAETKTLVIPQQVSPQKHQERTIQVRIDECRKRLEKVKATRKLPFKNEIIKFINAQLQELNRQKEIRKKVIAANTHKYHSNAALGFKGLQNVKDYQERRELREKFLKAPSLDPNAIIEDGVRLIDEVYPYEVDFLIAKNVDVNLADRSKLFGSAVYNQSKRQKLISFGMEDIDSGDVAPIFQVLKNNNNPRVVSISFNPLENMESMLLLSPLVDVADRAGNTLMHVAAKHNSESLARKLMYSGFTKFTQKNNAGKSPWDIALEHGCADVADFLAANGFATLESNSDMTYVELFRAISDNDPAALEKLVKRGADLYNCKFLHMELDALAFACTINKWNPEIINMILSKLKYKYADPDIKMVSKYHPLLIALFRNDAELFEFLIKSGVSSNRLFQWGSADYQYADFIFYMFKSFVNFGNGNYSWNAKSTAVTQMIKSMVKYDKTFLLNDSSRLRNITYRSSYARTYFSDYVYRSGRTTETFSFPLLWVWDTSNRLNLSDRYDLAKFMIDNGARLPENYSREFPNESRLNSLIKKGKGDHKNKEHIQQRTNTSNTGNTGTTRNTGNTRSTGSKVKQKYRRLYR